MPFRHLLPNLSSGGGPAIWAVIELGYRPWHIPRRAPPHRPPLRPRELEGSLRAAAREWVPRASARRDLLASQEPRPGCKPGPFVHTSLTSWLASRFSSASGGGHLIARREAGQTGTTILVRPREPGCTCSGPGESR